MTWGCISGSNQKRGTEQKRVEHMEKERKKKNKIENQTKNKCMKPHFICPPWAWSKWGKPQEDSKHGYTSRLLCCVYRTKPQQPEISPHEYQRNQQQQSI